MPNSQPDNRVEAASLSCGLLMHIEPIRQPILPRIEANYATWRYQGHIVAIREFRVARKGRQDDCRYMEVIPFLVKKEPLARFVQKNK